MDRIDYHQGRLRLRPGFANPAHSTRPTSTRSSTMRYLWKQLLLVCWLLAVLQSPGPATADDPQPQRYEFQARASELDPRAREYPEIQFVFGTDERPQDLQHASVDTRIDPQGKLVIWLMGHNPALFQRLNSYGLHAIQVSYANKWFGTLCRPQPSDLYARKGAVGGGHRRGLQ